MGRRLHRRTVLKAAAAAGGALLFGSRYVRRALAWTPVPPGIMLHARQEHLDNLPALLAWLREEGFTPVTYRALWDALNGSVTLPRQPVIISIDDLTLVKGSINFPFIARMVNICLARNAPVVLGINTEPLEITASGDIVQLRDQDEDQWAQAAVWASQGVELATHTQTHQNLVDRRLTPDDFQREIGGSAAFITARTGQSVTTLVLPYGNATADGRHDGPLYAPVETACRAARIGMVIGVAGGRVPLPSREPGTAPVYFVGRVGPLTGHFNSIYGDVTYWQRDNAIYRDDAPVP